MLNGHNKKDTIHKLPPLPGRPSRIELQFLVIGKEASMKAPENDSC
jgi:hypothetical protein